VWTVAACSSSAPSFAGLTSAGQTRRLRRLALSALEAYEVSVGGLVRLHGWNTTFRVDGPNGERHVLRVQRTDGPTATMVGSELAWLSALGRDTDLAVPQPVANRFGDPLTVAAAPDVPESRKCVLFQWVRGRFLDAGLTETRLRRVGILTARLQQHGQTMSMLDGFDRRRADEVTELGHSRGESLSPTVISATRDLVDDLHPGGGAVVAAVLQRVRRTQDLLGFGPDAYGLIHADLHQGNYLFHGDEVGVIDFDDCGWGHFAYDFAVTVSELEHLPRRATLRAALIAGYRSVRPLSAEQEAAVDDFIALRRRQLALWAVQHREQPMFAHSWKADLLHTLAQLR
jgi:Ser/Thr protein kinase RdoA (MazF antagonist)